MSTPPVVEARAAPYATNGSVATHIIDLPANIAATDLVLVFFVCDGNRTISWPSPWVVAAPDPGGNTSHTAALAWASGAALDGATTVTVGTGASEQAGALTWRISGAALEAPQQAGVGSLGGLGRNPDPPPLTTTESQAYLWLALEGHDGDLRTTHVFPTNYVNGIQIQSASGGGMGMAGAERTLTAVTEDPDTFTISNDDEWKAFTIAIAPADGEPPTGPITRTVSSVRQGVLL